MQSGKTMADPNRFKLDGRGYYLKSRPRCARCGPTSTTCARRATTRCSIAERCEVAFTEGTARTCRASRCPTGETEQSWFVKEVETGLPRRYPDGVPDDVRKQADYEVGVIVQMGFPGYFLVVADFINWAKDNGIRVGPGRGSGAGSIVAYAMRITDLDPLGTG